MCEGAKVKGEWRREGIFIMIEKEVENRDMDELLTSLPSQRTRAPSP